METDLVVDQAEIPPKTPETKLDSTSKILIIENSKKHYPKGVETKTEIFMNRLNAHGVDPENITVVDNSEEAVDLLNDENNIYSLIILDAIIDAEAEINNSGKKTVIIPRINDTALDVVRTISRQKIKSNIIVASDQTLPLKEIRKIEDKLIKAKKNKIINYEYLSPREKGWSDEEFDKKLADFKLIDKKVRQEEDQQFSLNVETADDVFVVLAKIAKSGKQPDYQTGSKTRELVTKLDSEEVTQEYLDKLKNLRNTLDPGDADTAKRFVNYVRILGVTDKLALMPKDDLTSEDKDFIDNLEALNFEAILPEGKNEAD